MQTSDEHYDDGEYFLLPSVPRHISEANRSQGWTGEV